MAELADHRITVENWEVFASRDTALALRDYLTDAGIESYVARHVGLWDVGAGRLRASPLYRPNKQGKQR